MRKDCGDCGYFKEYINRKEMSKNNSNEVLWLHICTNINMPNEVKNTSIANECEHYDDDSWLK